MLPVLSRFFYSDSELASQYDYARSAMQVVRRAAGRLAASGASQQGKNYRVVGRSSADTAVSPPATVGIRGQTAWSVPVALHSLLF